MANNFFKIDKGTTLTPQTAEPTGQNGDSYYNSTLGKFRFYENGSWKSLGSGSGSSGPNYILNPDAEAATTGWATYIDSDAVTFQDTGDTVTLTAHGLDNGQSVSFTSITSTTGISINTRYFVISTAANTFQLSLTAGGSAIALTTNGSGTLVRDRPVNMTAGSPSTTWTTSGTTPLRGTGSFLLTKSANNRMGEGVSYDFTIDNADQAKAFTVGFDYAVSSGTYADGDITIWVYDVTNAVLIQPTASSLLNITGTYGARKTASFQTNSNSTSYRVGLHISSVSAVAYTIKADTFSVSPNTYNEGANITDWKAYTPAVSAALGTITAINTYWRRVGDTLEVSGYFTAGTVTNVQVNIGFPTGLISDISKIGTVYVPIGWVTRNNSGTYYAIAQGNGNSFAVAKVTTDGSVAVTSTGNFSTGDLIAFTASCPIAGWGTSQILSSDTDTRVVAASYYRATNQSLSGTQQINFDTLLNDTHGAVTTGASWKFTAPVPGFYWVMANVNTATSSNMELFKNGSAFSFLTASGVAAGTDSLMPGGNMIYLNAGDFVDLRCTNSATIVGSGAPYSTMVSIFRLSGPAQIAASELVAAKYYAPTQAVNSTPTIIKYLTKEYDTHGASYSTTTGIFTCPSPGKYRVKVTLGATANTAANSINQALTLSLQKNGSSYTTLGYFVHQTTTAVYPFAMGDTTVQCLAGDTLAVLGSHNTAAGTWNASGDITSYIEFVRIGN
jgi:hypothetical protein